MPETKKGKYIVIEGGEGCGKTLQAELLYNYLLRERNLPCYLGREPGGIKSAEEMREILKHNSEDISAIGEVFGFEFSRAEFFDKIVIPKLAEGVNVISDRSGYSTEAYQGYGGGVDLEEIRLMNQIAMRRIQPDIAFIIDISPKQGLAKEVVKDRFSAKGFEYHQKVREGYWEVVKNNLDKCVLINYIPEGITEMQDKIRKNVNRIL